MSVDKNKAVINYLLQCEDIYNSPLYFNLIDAKDNSIQMLTTAEDKAMSKPFIDGSVQKRYTFNLITFKSISDMEIVKAEGYDNENVDELKDVQKLLDWVVDQDDLRNYPDFGDNCSIDSIDTTTDAPRFNGINTEITPPLAMYSISIVIEYLDRSKVIYNK
jgi:hypothetical protein